MPSADRTGMTLRDYVSILRRRKWTIVVTTLVMLGAALALSLSQTPIYQGRARLLLQTSQSAFNSQEGTPYDPTAVETEIQVIQSEAVRSAVRQQLGTAPGVQALPVGGTKVVELRAQSTSPERAAEITNAYANSYIEFRRQRAVDSLLAIAKGIQDKINPLQTEVDDLARRIAEIPPCTGSNPPPNCAQRDALQRDRDARVEQLVPFKQRADQLQVDASLKDGGATLVSEALVPIEPVRPRPVRNAVLAIAVGLIVGVALAFLFEQLDDSIKTKEDLERLVRDLPVLGMIPAVSGWKKSDVLVVSQAEPSSPAAEAYRTLRTSVQFLGVDRPIRTLQITSATASDGKSSTTCNLGVSLARAGKRVIIASCDLRRPRLHEFFGLSNAMGFTSVLLGEHGITEAVQPVPKEDRLKLLASGPLPPNPSELLSSHRASEVLERLSAHSDMVLLDCPPVLPVTDAVVLSAKVDATLIVVNAGSTTGKQLSRTLELLRQAGAPLIGVVFNNVSTEGAYGYTYYYRRDEDGDRERAPKRRGKPTRSDRGSSMNGASTGQPAARSRPASR
ncbi:MAG: polysaccharide biosynthesis tyrosine autokinase [Acidimicrobiales bacterium]